MLPSSDDCNDCLPAYLKPSLKAGTIIQTFPFAFSFLALAAVVYFKIYPLLSAPSRSEVRKYESKFDRGPVNSSRHGVKPMDVTNRVTALTFSTTIALSVVLTQLLFCEITNFFDPGARSVALRFTITTLLGLLIVIIPLLELYSVITKSGWSFVGAEKGRLRLAWVLEIGGYAIFLMLFWFIGYLLPKTRDAIGVLREDRNLLQICLERIGLAGITFMALLSGFASVSSIWQNLIAKPRLVSEVDITRKQAGLDATLDMLAEKKERIQQLERKMSTQPVQGFWSRTMTSLKGNADTQEHKMLELEISGLDTMANSLESSLSVVHSRRTDQLRSRSTLGRISIAFAYVFTCYCIYRICTTTINVFRRSVLSRQSSAATDPVTNTIALFARHVYPSLDQASSARQISFLLSGVMLLASFSAVMQTFHLFARFVPSVLQTTRSNFALLISQISGMYVISSALMLRGMMPKEVGSVINDALGTNVLEPAWVEKWFDGIFGVAVLVTAIGLWGSRQLGGNGAWDDDAWDVDVEMGKRR